jgi:exonuclease SbcC
VKIHSLTLEGFGPFKARQTIDFDALSADRLFMLEGPTGSGKSSIIDAIVYALYGNTAQQGAGKAATAGARSETDRMSQHRIRSDYCGIDDPTEVTLEFSNGNGRYRIRRVPALPRLKRDGTEDLSNPKAELMFIRPEALPITGPNEVARRINEIVGLDEKQFNQLIVLPQGKFTTFLFADRSARELILTDIFRTFFYDRLALELATRKKKFEEETKHQENELTHHVRNLQGIDGTGDDKDWNGLLAALKNPAEVRSAQDGLIEGFTGNMYVDIDSQSDELEATKKIELDLQAQKNKLDQEIKSINELKGFLKDLELLKRSDADIVTKEEQLKIISQIEPLASAIEEYIKAEKSLNEVKRQVPKAYADVASKDIRSKVEKLNSALKVLEKELGKDENLEDQIDTLTEKIDEGEEIERAKSELEKSRKRVPGLEAALEKAKKALADYRKNRTVAGASTLAKALKAGQPCPVCGSKEHPKKAKGESYDENHERELEQEKEDASEALNECKSDIKTLSEKAKVDERDELDSKIQELNETYDLILEYEGAKKAFESLERQLSSQVKKHNVKNPRELKGLISGSSNSLKSAIDKHKSEKAKLKGLVGQAKYKELRELKIVNNELKGVSDQLTEARKRIADITGLKATAAKTNTSIDASRNGLFKALDDLEEVREKSQDVVSLEAITRGAGGNKMDLKLQRYVLQEKLGLVLERASGILYKISGSKFEFKLQNEKIKGQLGKSGLGITVLDLCAGKERPAETLSGGEAFYASLALALGLAEVIRADRGGLELGTLFIDEGFGLLDEDKLDEVLQEIESLGATSRIIGVISHVESMKARFPTRLEVRATKEGPSLVKMVGA